MTMRISMQIILDSSTHHADACFVWIEQCYIYIECWPEQQWRIWARWLFKSAFVRTNWCCYKWCSLPGKVLRSGTCLYTLHWAFFWYPTCDTQLPGRLAIVSWVTSDICRIIICQHCMTCVRKSQLIKHNYFSYVLHLQLIFTATCCNQGSQQKRLYTADVGNVSAINTLNFTFAGTNSSVKFEVNKACGHIWMEDPRSMWQGTVLRCAINMTISQDSVNRYTCIPSSGMVCRNGNTTSLSCNGLDRGRSKVLCNCVHMTSLCILHQRALIMCENCFGEKGVLVAT